MPIRFLADQSIDDLLSVDRVNLGSTVDSDFITGTSRLTANGYIMAKAIVNTSETGTGPAAIVFGNGSTLGNDQISLVTVGNTRMYIDSTSVDVNNTLVLSSVVNAGTDTDKFLVLDSGGRVDFRTGAEVRSDIGAGTGSGTVTGTGTTNNIVKFTNGGSGVIGDSSIGGADKAITLTVTDKGLLTSVSDQDIDITASQVSDFCTAVSTCIASNEQYAADIGGATSIAVTHNLGTRDVMVQLYDVSSYDTG